MWGINTSAITRWAIGVSLLTVMEAKVERILEDFRWGRIDDVFLGLPVGDLKSWPAP